MTSQGFFISRGRVYALIIAVCLVWMALVGRLINIQLVRGEQYRAISDNQSRGEVEVPSERGRIFDDHGRTLASNTATRSFFAYPPNEAAALEIANVVAPYMNVGRNELRAKLKSRVEQFTWLCRRIDGEKADALEARKLPGLFSQREMQRAYPRESLGRDLLGTVDTENQGISGLEFALNGVLNGAPGKTRVERDAVGNIYRVASKDLVDPRNGNDVQLTIDLDWQAIVEQELKNGVDTFSAQSGIAVFLRPNDGAILAMASYYPYSKSAASQKNEAIADVFEPGSVFKLVAIAGALEEGSSTPTDHFNCGGGKAQFSGKWIHDDHKWGDLAVKDIFAFSSNIGTARVACKLGNKTLFKYAKYFGFGMKSGIDMPGEMPGILREPNKWSDFFTSQLAMGHGVCVTALQLASAFSVVCSEGALYQPYIIRKITAPTGEIVEQHAPTKVRTLLSKETCDQLKQFMKAVVDTGTGKYSKSKVITFAGKTGTAQKVNLENGGYYQNSYISTFAGHFPAESPIAVGVIVLDDAQPVHYAGMTSARIFRRIAERLSTKEKLTEPELFAAQKAKSAPREIRVPELEGHTLSTVQELLDTIALDVSFVNSGDIITRQVPKPGSVLLEGERLIVQLTSAEQDSAGPYSELIGMSVRSAVAQVRQWGYEFDVEGSGFVKHVIEVAPDSLASTRSLRLICSVD